MAMSEGRAAYPSLSKLQNGGKKFNNVDDCPWGIPETDSDHSPAGSSSGQLNLYKFSYEPEDYLDAGYDSSDEKVNMVPQNGPPEVNLKNVLSGIFSILMGKNKSLATGGNVQFSNTDVSFLGSAKNGDTFLHSSVCLPSAPPLLEPTPFNLSAFKDVLETEPPEWLPDSSTKVCMQCNSPFTALTRGRHHCRFCGGIFCKACSQGRSLLPVKFRERNPQRVCDTCYDRLDPLQSVLINTISNAVQVAKHDVMDWTCMRGWLNLPVGMSMEHEIYKATNTLRSYCQVIYFLFELVTITAIFSSVFLSNEGEIYNVAH